MIAPTRCSFISFRSRIPIPIPIWRGLGIGIAIRIGIDFLLLNPVQFELLVSRRGYWRIQV